MKAILILILNWVAKMLTYRIEGNENLSNNNIVRIIVTSNDGTEIVYQIRIVNDNSILNEIIYFVENNWLYIVVPLGVIIILIIIIKMIKSFKETRLINKSSL